MTQERFDEIRARCEKATPGPWVCKYPSGWVTTASEPNRTIARMFYRGESMESSDKADVDFIAHARQDIPDLLDALEAETKRADEAEKTLELHDIIRNSNIEAYLTLEAERNQLKAALAEMEKVK